MKSGNFGGSKSKAKAQGSSSETITHTKERKTSKINDTIMSLRAALFEEDGKDKDVTSGLSSLFMNYNKNELDLSITFSPKLISKERHWAFDLTKDHMEEVYESSGYGWDDDEKERDLSEDGARFLLVRNNTDNKLVAFVHFRFTVQGEVVDQMTGESCLYIWDLHVEKEYQKKGLGSHLMLVLELIAGREKMKYCSFPVQNDDEIGKAFINKRKAYAADVYVHELLSFDPKEEGFEIFSKAIGVRPKPKVATPTTVTPVASVTTDKKDESSGNIFGFGAAPSTTPAKSSDPHTTNTSPTGIIDKIEEDNLGFGSGKVKTETIESVDSNLERLSLN